MLFTSGYRNSAVGILLCTTDSEFTLRRHRIRVRCKPTAEFTLLIRRHRIRVGCFSCVAMPELCVWKDYRRSQALCPTAKTKPCAHTNSLSIAPQQNAFPKARLLSFRDLFSLERHYSIGARSKQVPCRVHCRRARASLRARTASTLGSLRRNTSGEYM